MYAVQADHHAESPLDTLVRKTSMRREHVPRQDPRTGQLQQSVSSEELPSSRPYIGTREAEAHYSPLLHGHFARDSYATSSSKDYNSFLATSTRSSTEYHYHDTDSVYSVVHSSWPAVPNQTPPVGSAYAGLDLKRSPYVDSGMNPLVPSVVVSCADTDEQEDHLRRGRTPIMASRTPNFSLPGRPAIPPSGHEKRRVLERNVKKVREPSPSFDNGFVPSQNLEPSHESRSFPLPRSGTAPSGQGPVSTSFRSASRSPSPLATVSPIVVGSLQPTNSGLQNPTQLGLLSSTGLLRTPPPRSSSPATSLYSSYSYYPFEGPASRSTSNSPSPTGQHRYVSIDTQSTQTPESINDITSQGPQTPQEYLQLGIQCHEANKLEDSAQYFEKSANEKGGCGVGMLMWGLTLRHGWGCQKDEKKGFKWLRRAAENAVEDLENARIGGSLDPQAIQTELVLAIYEVGQCFFQGWGVPKDQKMAVSYYQVAARLGDSDAQNDLAFCLANGKGCKKDRKEAAKWYRAAVAQGQSDIGLAWIYKEKYQ